MARARKKAQSGGSRRGGASRGATRSKSRKAAKAEADTEVEVVEEGPGLSMEDGIVIVTTVILFFACMLVDYWIGSDYGRGMLFGG